jgi:hypothetical protein
MWVFVFAANADAAMHASVPAAQEKALRNLIGAGL